MTWSSRVVYQARAWGFEDELTVAEGEGLSVGADVFDGSKLDPVRLRNAHVVWITLINNCRELALEIVQRSKAPNDAWRNLESHYRAKGTRETLRLSHEVNGKTMQPGGDPFRTMMEIDLLAADLKRLGDRSVLELRKCVIIVAGLSAEYKIEVRVLENNPAGLERAEIERVVRNQFNILFRQQQNSKTLSASKGTTTADRGEKNRRPRNQFKGSCFNCGRKGNRADDCRSAKKIKKSGAFAADKKSGGRGKCYVCGSEEHLAHKHCGLCRSLEHRTRDCEERGAKKGAMLAKLNVPANSEVGLVAATVEAARGSSSWKWQRGMGFGFRCVIPYALYTSRNDCLQEGAYGDDC